MNPVKADRHLVPLLPAMGPNGNCPACGGASVTPLGTVFPGIHVLGRYACAACGHAFLRDLPVSHALSFPITVSQEGRPEGAAEVPPWLLEPFLAGFKAQRDEEVKIERRVFRAHRKVVVLNTLDFLYGHVLLKLYNALHYIDRHPDLGLVVILPRMYAWLIPEGCAEAWIVDLGLGRLQGWYNGLDRFVQGRLPAYDEVYLAPAYSHPDVAGMDVSRFSGVKPFDPATFNTAPLHVTFVTREDRLWFRNKVTRFLYRASNRLRLRSIVAPLAVRDQDRLVRAVMHSVRKADPKATFSVVGLGDARMNGSGVEDLRTRTMNVEVEQAWCRAYARSQVVVGVHGSNMLLPTAHAGACIEILPRQRFENIVQDVTVRYEGRAMLFHYRFVDEHAAPGDIALHIGSLRADREVFMRNNHVNVF
jgi:hypothetical protein